jgi:hypothetical protein
MRFVMMATHDPVDTALIERILGEYREMPGLALTLGQACRLWGCDGTTCRVAVEILVTQGELHWSRDGRLVRGAAANREALS